MIASLILGILSCVFCFVGIFFATIPMSIISIVLGVFAIAFGVKNREEPTGLAGLICGIVGTSISVTLLIIMLVILF